MEWVASSLGNAVCCVSEVFLGWDRRNVGYALPSLVLFILLNLLAFRVILTNVNEWVRPTYRRRVLVGISIILLILNLPLSVFFYRPLDALLVYFPTRVMENLFLPSFAWVMTLLFCSFILAALAASTAIVSHTKRLFSRRRTERSSAGLEI
jgi:formate hydrogenlyase subunit 3/multisubunit Na+/H+ antiporter MnhD subunit